MNFNDSEKELGVINSLRAKEEQHQNRKMLKKISDAIEDHKGLASYYSFHRYCYVDIKIQRILMTEENFTVSLTCLLRVKIVVRKMTMIV